MFPNFESHNLYCAKPLMLTCLSSAEASSSLPCKSVSCCTSSRSLAPNCCSALCRSLISLQKQLQGNLDPNFGNRHSTNSNVKPETLDK